jgi:hypothetical protein
MDDGTWLCIYIHIIMVERCFLSIMDNFVHSVVNIGVAVYAGKKTAFLS